MPNGEHHDGPKIRMSTMCTCGDMQTTAHEGENLFEPHLDRTTGQPCPGLKLCPTCSGKSMRCVDCAGMGTHGAYATEQMRRLRGVLQQNGYPT